MIEVKNLVKIYKNNKKESCALNDVSFTLPDKGMIFVIGKSGSGKSTLLNSIAALDSITSGEVIVDGNNISKLKPSQLSKYHASHIGFIFQDYHLIEELTVYQNIEIALDFVRDEDKSIISKMLENVGLSGYESRYPKELSGGECQRVAIARALAKKPKLILGDEPTGNLDGVTTPQVLKLLKEISKEKLVIIVSHNLGDADKYADRILELSEGKLISDRVRVKGYENKFKIENETLYLPHNLNLSQDELTLINSKKDEIKNVIQIDNGFRHSTYEEYEEKSSKFEGKKISSKNITKLLGLFFKKNLFSKFLTILLAAIIISVFYVLQAFATFNGNEALANDIITRNEPALVIQKSKTGDSSQSSSSMINSIVDEEVNSFKSSYNGEVYKLYNNTITIKSASISNESVSLVTALTSSFYITETYGTLNCDMEFLKELYGQNGNLEVLAGEINNPKYGVVITDYVADSIMFYNPNKYKSYDDLIGPFQSLGYMRNYISAVIETGYEDKYSEVKSIYNEAFIQGVNYPLFDELASCDAYPLFLDDVNKFLGISYNVSPTYFEDIKDSNYIPNYLIFRVVLTDKSGFYYYSKEARSINNDTSYNLNLKDNELSMGYLVYNKIFGSSFNETNYKDFTPREMTITKYDYFDSETIVYQKTFVIKELVKPNIGFIVNEANYKEMMVMDTLAYRLYFSDIEKAEKILEVSEEKGYFVISNDTTGISLVSRSIKIFGAFIQILEYIMLIVCIFYLTSFGIKSIRNNYYEIGVIKALGGRTRDIARIFIFQTLIVGIGIVLVSILGIHIASDVANEILIESFKAIFGIKFYKLRIISVYPSLVSVDLGIVIFIIFISALIPTLSLRKFKPIDILQAKE